jgi:hypothetical protein
VEERLPGKYKALSSVPNTEKKKKRKNRKKKDKTKNMEDFDDSTEECVTT